MLICDRSLVYSYKGSPKLSPRKPGAPDSLIYRNVSAWFPGHAPMAGEHERPSARARSVFFVVAV